MPQTASEAETDAAQAPAPRAGPLSLGAPVLALRGVGEKKAKSLHRLGLRTLGDLLDYLPRDYRFEGSERGVDGLVNEQIQTARGKVVAVDYIAGRPRSRFEATLEDDAGKKLAVVWFNAAWMRGKVRPGMLLRVRGKVRTFRNMPQMANPKWEAIEEGTEAVAEDKYRPLYAATSDLGSEQIEAIIADHLDEGAALLPDALPPALRQKRRLPTRGQAYTMLHRPRNQSEAAEGRRRVVYDEFLLLQLGLGLGKRLRQGRISAPVLRIDRTLDGRIRSRFPFDMTRAQQNAAWEIAHDLKSGSPMNRLLQGDVGSGKTVVALYAMLTAVANKMQAALLAPTEVLAGQHYLTLKRFLDGSNVRLGLVTGRTKRGKAKEAVLESLVEGELDIAVGTQALLQEDVDFANLGLIVVDEQHKLGVKQRAFLRDRGHSPHYLVMTATPIPRTLALSYLADFDVSTIDELPPGRQPIETKHLKAEHAARAYDFVRRQVERGRQAYVVMPQIDDDGLTDVKSVRQHFAELEKGPLAGLRLAMLHGQMPADEKDAAMRAFRAGEADVLVATTVIEVGVDVPNATVMVIENAERFGLSQLHQLRGRVGRGAEKSWCILVSDLTTPGAQQRIGAMCDTTDGFALAEVDLQLRGPGDFFGTRQHGLPPLKVANLTEELDLLHEAKDDALALLDGDPRLSDPQHHALRGELLSRYGQTLQLALVG